MRLESLKHRLDPAYLASEVRRVGKKLARRWRNDEAKVVSLAPAGPERGSVLFSYVLAPFLLPPGAPIPGWHTHFWESLQMARTFVDLGYRVDAIDWTNHRFLPARPYDVLIDVRQNLERLAPHLPGALKVFHADTAHWRFNNQAQQARLERLRDERGLALRPVKTMPENLGIETADCATLLGNRFTRSTYDFAAKPVFRVPLSTTLELPWPEGKDFDRVRRRFLWLGSGGLVHKGLDLVLEAFAGLPDLELVVCGPVRQERDFERAFFRELYQLPNVETVGWVELASPRFRAIADSCLAMVYPSCSEGGGGSVLTAMHAGLVPVVTREASIDLAPAYGLELGGATVATIRGAALELSSRPAAELEAMARAAWTFVRHQHTRDHFAAAYLRFATALVEGTWRALPEGF